MAEVSVGYYKFYGLEDGPMLVAVLLRPGHEIVTRQFCY